LLKHSLTVFATLVVTVALTPSTASAQVLKRGIQGGVAGAIIGGIIDGGKGAGRGAAIGAGVGVVAGAIEAENNARRSAYYGPPPGSNLVYDTQSALLRLGYNPGPPTASMASARPRRSASINTTIACRSTGNHRRNCSIT
jgi:hypothetical protein